jgi:hypothetical protein
MSTRYAPYDAYLSNFFSIMKYRKTMKNQPLIQEVISRVSQRFTPKVLDIKKVCRRLFIYPLLH